MKIRSPIYLCAAIFLLSACVRSPIDAKKKDTSRTEMTISKNAASQLTDKDIFGNETTLAVSEEDIQAALDGEKFSVPTAELCRHSGQRTAELCRHSGPVWQSRTRDGHATGNEPVLPDINIFRYPGQAKSYFL
ncbi:putative aminopeptidase [Salmonella enterica subsp. enterica serovar Wandsworth str. A4-580]|uniref:Putative aminopeptidase n=1 Tax=Salmonella enterica subsp. enterica serovar Wandsworth str. A4-580 TaxID=913086 RepID=G5S9H5_SALET|nr:putative aminopeptidase [Salmonella enterica subsp. enterica serovar Wandsworth str. A4-580]